MNLFVLFCVFFLMSGCSYLNGSGDVTSNSGEETPQVSDISIEDSVVDKNYMEYSKKVFDRLTSDTSNKVILFFHASWCPTCKLADGNLQEDIDFIPRNVYFLKVDYDDSSDLKDRYGVVNQHTFVQVDSNAELVNLWNGTSDLDDILTNIK